MRPTHSTISRVKRILSSWWASLRSLSFRIPLWTSNQHRLKLLMTSITLSKKSSKTSMEPSTRNSWKLTSEYFLLYMILYIMIFLLLCLSVQLKCLLIFIVWKILRSEGIGWRISFWGDNLSDDCLKQKNSMIFQISSISLRLRPLLFYFLEFIWFKNQSRIFQTCGLLGSKITPKLFFTTLTSQLLMEWLKSFKKLKIW